MWEDPIVEEVHAIRDQLLARFGGDFHKYCEYVLSLPAATDGANRPTMPIAAPADSSPRLKAG